VAAARSTGLRPIHFIHFVRAAVTNRGTNLLEGTRNHYRIVMFGKLNFAGEITYFASRVCNRTHEKAAVDSMTIK
jgi:hypothetical protein